MSGFLMDNPSWKIMQVPAETGHWYAGKEILIPPGRIGKITYEDSQLFVNLARTAIEHTANHDAVKAGA